MLKFKNSFNRAYPSSWVSVSFKRFLTKKSSFVWKYAHSLPGCGPLLLLFSVGASGQCRWPPAAPSDHGFPTSSCFHRQALVLSLWPVSCHRGLLIPVPAVATSSPKTWNLALLETKGKEDSSYLLSTFPQHIGNSCFCLLLHLDPLELSYTL